MTDQVKIAVVGAGYWGKNLVRNFEGLGVLGLICDSRMENLEAFSERYPEILLSDSFQSVLEDTSMEAVAIAILVWRRARCAGYHRPVDHWRARVCLADRRDRETEAEIDKP